MDRRRSARPGGRGPPARPPRRMRRRTGAPWKASSPPGPWRSTRAVNLFSLDRGLVESLRGLSARAPSPSAAARLGSAVATALVPVLVFVWGLKSRRPTLLRLGALFAVLSLVTLRTTRTWNRSGHFWPEAAVALILGGPRPESPAAEIAGRRAERLHRLPALPGSRDRGVFRLRPRSSGSRPAFRRRRNRAPETTRRAADGSAAAARPVRSDRLRFGCSPQIEIAAALRSGHAEERRLV